MPESKSKEDILEQYGVDNETIPLEEISRMLEAEYKDRVYEIVARRNICTVFLSVTMTTQVNGKKLRIVGYSPMIQEHERTLEELTEDEAWVRQMLVLPLYHIECKVGTERTDALLAKQDALLAKKLTGDP